jgi:hypothetical protein
MKIWLFMPLSFLFTFAQMPMLLKHGLGQRKVQKKIEMRGTIPRAPITVCLGAMGSAFCVGRGVEI